MRQSTKGYAPDSTRCDPAKGDSEELVQLELSVKTLERLFVTHSLWVEELHCNNRRSKNRLANLLLSAAHRTG